MTRSDAEMAEALAGLAYDFVMLGEALSRIELLQQRPFSVEPRPEGFSWGFWSGSVATTSGEPWEEAVERFGERRSLTEFRAYVDWSLLLARKVSDVVSSKSSRNDDVLASELLEDETYALDPLDQDLRTRIGKMVAHQTYFEDSERKGWPMGDIARWRSETLQQFTADLFAANADRADAFEAALDRYRTEVKELR